eukprot:scaffold7333_cov196-Pinguiococcus_pyrenoidosus.AAC.3
MCTGCRSLSIEAVGARGYESFSSPSSIPGSGSSAPRKYETSEKRGLRSGQNAIVMHLRQSGKVILQAGGSANFT